MQDEVDETKADDPEPYLRRIQRHNRRFPSLKLLNTLPEVPLHPTKANILEFRESGVTPIEILNVHDLEEYLDSTSQPSYHPKSENDVQRKDSRNTQAEKDDGKENNPKERCKGRIYIIQDISLPFISTLGSHFNMDPRFFVEYLKFDPDRTQNFLDNYSTMRRLPSLRQTPKPPPHNFGKGRNSARDNDKGRESDSKGDYATFVYHEIRTFHGTAPRREEYEILTRDNVGRLVTTVDHHMGQVTGLVRRNLGVWWGWRDEVSSSSSSDDRDDSKDGLGDDEKGDGQGEKEEGKKEDDGEKEEDEDDGRVWDAVILVDPPTPNEFNIRPWGLGSANFTPVSCLNTAYLGGTLDFSAWPPPPPDSPACTPPPPSSYFSLKDGYEYHNHNANSTDSLLASITHHYLHSSPQSLSSVLTSPKLAALPALHLISSHWNLQLDYLIAVVSEMEKGLLKFEQMPAYPTIELINAEVSNLRALLSDANSWRRRLFFYEEHVLWDVENASAGLKSLCNLGSGNRNGKGEEIREQGRGGDEADAWAGTVHDLHTIHTHLHLLTKRIQSVLPIVMGAFSLLEARRSVLKDDLTIRLSGVALVFVPLSFTAELLSMSDEFMPGRKLFWVFFVVSAPLIVGGFWWAFWAQVGRVRRWMGRRLVWRERRLWVRDGEG